MTELDLKHQLCRRQRIAGRSLREGTDDRYGESVAQRQDEDGLPEVEQSHEQVADPQPAHLGVARNDRLCVNGHWCFPAARREAVSDSLLQRRWR